MNATRTVRRARIERLPAWSATAYLTLASVNSGWTKLDDDERFALEVVNVRADDAGTVTIHPRDCLRLCTSKRDTVSSALLRRALAALVRGEWLVVRRLRGGAYRYRLTLPRGVPRERLERKHLYLPLQDRPGHQWRRPSGWRPK